MLNARKPTSTWRPDTPFAPSGDVAADDGSTQSAFLGDHTVGGS